MNEVANYQNAVQVANLIISLVIAFGGIVPVVNFLRKTLGTSARYSQALAVGVCVVYTILSMLVQGAIAPDSLSMGNAGTLFIAVFSASQAEYQRYVRAQDKGDA